MILSVSKRTDIPAFYADWFMKRIEEGYVCTRNPYQKDHVYTIKLNPVDVDMIVFWTKNPAPMIDYLPTLDTLKYKYYFQTTLNYYGNEVEPAIPGIEERIRTFIRLSNLIGKEKNIWRYDPILFSNTYTPEWHKKCFETLAAILAPYTEKVVVSIVDMYAKNNEGMARINAVQATHEAKIDLLRYMAEIAREHNIEIATCAEEMPELAQYGIKKNSCVDRKLIERLVGSTLSIKPANQRGACGCVENIDIGSYDTCRHGCVYCYANPAKSSSWFLNDKISRYDINSPILCDAIDPELDIVTERKIYSLRDSMYPF